MSKEKGEVYYITPSGKKLRTRHEIQNHLHDDLTISNFTLVKEAIGASPDDEIIRSAKYYNYARRSAVDPVFMDSTPPPVLGKRVPKPKMPKGASPPPPQTPSINNSPVMGPMTPTLYSSSSNTNHAKNAVPLKENQYDLISPSQNNKVNSARKTANVKGKTK